LVAYDDDEHAEEMQKKKMVHQPDNKLHWGTTPQVVHLKWECMGAPTITKRDYPIDYEIDYGNVDETCGGGASA
jgi:hypothetical protein